MADQIIEELKLLADDLNIRSPAKLLAVARKREIRDATLKFAQQALAKDVGRQVFAPKPRSLGKSAAENPNTRLQADLIDFSQNARNKTGAKYAVLVGDVFTRELEVRPLKSKNPDEVNAALGHAINDLVEGKKDNYVVTTDKGGEFADVQNILPDDAVHRVKEGVNDMAVLDRGMQTVKKDLGARIAKRGGTWDEHLGYVVDAYNEKPNEAVYGAPEDVEEGGVQEFMVLKDNAQKFMQNKKLTQRRVKDVQEAGGFRAPVPTGGRSFNPQYSSNVYALQKITPGAQFVQNTTGRGFLLKEVQPAPRDSGKPQGRLTDPNLGRRSRYQQQANRIEDFIADQGGSITMQDLRNNLTRIGLQRFFRGLNMQLPAFLRLFSSMFTLQNGQVRLKNYQTAAAPPPESREERLARLMREDRERDLERQRRREEQQRARVGGLRAAYGDRPV